jgi:hypothetical protein
MVVDLYLWPPGENNEPSTGTHIYPLNLAM